MACWKTKLTVNDLSDTDKLELQCRKCGQVRYLYRPELIERGAGQLYLDEVESRARCKVLGCKGAMRLALVRQHKVSAFIGGIA